MLTTMVAGAEIDGWMGKGPRRWLAEQAAQRRAIIEVGVWKGRSTRILARATKGTVWAVDHWRGTPDDAAQHALYGEADAEGKAVYREFKQNLKAEIRAGKVVVVRMDSLEAAEYLRAAHGPVFDMVFIDGDHSYAGCRLDIEAYRPLLRKGGLLSGHDYKDAWPGVMQAVDEMVPDVERGPGSVWFTEV